MNTTAPRAVLTAVAEALANAEALARPIGPISKAHPELTVDDAYAIQTLTVQARAIDARRPARVIGHKIGLTSLAMQEQLGVSEPDFGVLYDDRVLADGAGIDLAGLIAPRIEPELAFILAADLEGPGVTAADVRAATEAVVPALEVIDSRIADWKIGLVDTIADNASCHCAVLGARRFDLAAISPPDAEVTLSVDGQAVQAGAGTAVLGDPAVAVAWLANALARYGHGLKAGQVVLSGSMTAAVPLTAGSRVVADFGLHGTVEVTAR